MTGTQNATLQLNNIGEWLWHTEKDRFKLSLRAEYAELCDAESFASIHDFLALLTNKGRLQLIECCECVLEGGLYSSFTCQLVIPNKPVQCILVEITKVEKALIRANLTSLIQIPSSSEFATVFEAIFDNNHHGVILCDARTNIVAANRYVENSSGYRLAELIGQPTSIFNAGKHNRAFFKQLWKEIKDKGFWTGNLLSRKKTGEVFPQEITIQQIKTSSDKQFYIGFTLDLSDRLYRIVDRESGGIELLTQLPSEQVFKSALINSITNAAGYKGPIVVAFTPQFDPENQIHERKELSGALAKHDDNYMAGYFGNNIFVISISAFDCASSNVIHLIASKIQSVFGRIKTKLPSGLFKRIVGGKIGVSIYGVDTTNPKLLIPHAMQAMVVHAQDKGRSVSFYDAKIHDSIKRREVIENTIRNSIFSRSLDVHFQPIVCTSSWKIAKFESLCRFPKVEGHEFETQEMIRVTEELNLVNELDRCIASMAINHLPALQDMFGAELAISTNFSLCTDHSVEKVMQGIHELILQSGIGSKHITIELTESAYFGSGQKSEDAEPLMSLRNNGVSIAIDDFGTGYSSFAYLTGKNFDFLKIDKEFVLDLQVGSREYFIVKMIVELAHILGVKVIAEGVETLSDVKILTDLKVDYLQGFYFSRPVPMDKIMSAQNYLDNVEELMPYTVTGESSQNLASLVNRNIPQLEPSLSFQYLKKLFERVDIDYVAIMDNNQCVGVIDREIFNLHSSPTLGTDIEKRSDLEVLKRSLVQMMRPPEHVAKVSTPISKAVEWLKEKRRFPWVVVDQNGHYVGLVGKQEVMEFFASQYICID